MTDFDALPPHLQRLGCELMAAADEIRATRDRGRHGWRRPTRRVAAGVALAAVAIPGAALAATQLIDSGQVAAGLASGSRALVGTDPTCTVVQADVQYRCTLAKAPSDGGPVQFAVMAQAREDVKVIIAENGRSVQAVMRGATLAEYKHVLAQALAVAKADAATNTGAAAKAETAAQADPSGTPAVRTTIRPGIATPARDWTGTVELTVDSTKHVNGGCRALNATGTQWNCYLGHAAVRQKIISQSLLGRHDPIPAVG